MDDTQVAFLPPDLAAEAQTLRRELEERHRRLMQDRLYSQGLPPVILGDTLLSLIIMAASPVDSARLGNREEKSQNFFLCYCSVNKCNFDYSC